ncbi:MAG TPA: polysaccharide deacetylase family protein [Cyclobacteriaceae bacterium]
MKKIIATALSFLAVMQVVAQQKSIQERLGYPKETKLLIIHADDLGVSHSENTASFYALEKGSVTSASMMVPCPWFLEVAAYAKSHPLADLGLHLTLTSEWKLYKWGPVSTNQNHMVDDRGFFNDNVEALVKNASPADVEKELRSQIELALKAGVKPTHFDAHMGCVFSTADYLQILIKLGREYKVPVLLNREAEQYVFHVDIDKYITDQDILVDKIVMASPEDFKKGIADFYSNTLQTLQPGLNCLLLHAAYDNDEMKAITVEHPDYGAAWRQADFNFFTSDACKKLIADKNIKLITWKEIKDKLVH